MLPKSNIDQAYEVWCLYLTLVDDQAPDGLIKDRWYQDIQTRNDQILYSAVCTILSGIPFEEGEFKIAQKRAENASIEERIRIKTESEFMAKIQQAIKKDQTYEF